jgi:predicted nucleotide-binding protein
MNKDSIQIFRLIKYYNFYKLYLNYICKGSLIVVDEDTNKMYLKLCKKIDELLKDPVFENIRNEDWKPFENIRESDIDVHWEYVGIQRCERFTSLIEELALEYNEPQNYLTDEDIQFFDSISAYLDKYKDYKTNIETNFENQISKKIESQKLKLDFSKENISGKIFIGHGRSSIWLELKDFIQDRLKLQWEEYNRIPTAGISTSSRLEEMLNNSCFAFLIMTAEDEQNDGTIRARENVVHEAGLFQGKLGFRKAIILLEEGCEEFSNIKGLGEIRFRMGKINEKFEEIRKTLEREGLLDPN